MEGFEWTCWWWEVLCCKEGDLQRRVAMVELLVHVEAMLYHLGWIVVTM